MHVPKNYFHDRMILALLSSSVFLTVLGSLLILLRLDSGSPDSYVVQYRADLGLGGFKSGDSTTFFSVVAFLVFVLLFHTLLSIKVYGIRRQFAVTILAMAVLLMILTIIVSNALLVMR